MTRMRDLESSPMNLILPIRNNQSTGTNKKCTALSQNIIIIATSQVHAVYFQADSV